MDTNEVKPEQPGNNADLTSSGGGSSCASGPASSREKTWKTVVFVIVVALAGTLAAHSMLTASRCGGCGGGGGRWMNDVAVGCPLQTGAKAAACPSEKACCPGAQASFKTAGCPLAEQETKACPNSPGAKAPGCCPGGGYRWGQK
jgi:hypothetical protein